MHEDHRFDFLLSPEGTQQLYAAHRSDTPDVVATVRDALRSDSRTKVRVNAIVALSASQKTLPAEVFAALDDQDPAVTSEAAFTIATFAKDSVSHPTDEKALETLRAHVENIRRGVTSSSSRVRFNTLSALAVIADDGIDLPKVLGDGDALVRLTALDLAGSRASAGHKLSAADVAALDLMGRKDPDQQMRIKAVNLVAYYASDAAVPVVTAALQRGDVDLSTSRYVGEKKISALTPAIVTYLEKNPKQSHWIGALVALNATCASQALSALLDEFPAGPTALEALRSLSGHSEWARPQLVEWAKKQAKCS